MSSPTDGLGVDTTRRIVTVGASLAGLTAAAELRRLGFAGSLTLVGDETHLPYDRAPLTKGVLTGAIETGSTRLVGAEDLEADWLLGVAAVRLDRERRLVVLADGRQLPYDRVLVATGRRARLWPKAHEAAFDNVVTIRRREDAHELRGRLRRARKVMVLGAGFIGSEVASSCRELGLDVTIVDLADAPLETALGQPFSTAAATLQRRHGVDLRMRTSITRMIPGNDDDDRRVRQVQLDDGSVVDVDLVVVAIGSVPNTEWLAGAGLAVDPRYGLACDGTLRAVTDEAMPDDAVYAAGDVAQVPHPVYDNQLIAVEHWGTAVDHGRIAAHNMISGPGGRRTVTALPRFWSNQFGVNIKSVGLPTAADHLVVVQGSVESERGVLLYGRAGVTVAAVSLNAPRELEPYVTLITSRAPFPPDLNLPDRAPSGPPPPVPVRFARSDDSTRAPKSAWGRTPTR